MCFIPHQLEFTEHDRLIKCLTLGWTPKQKELPLFGIWGSVQSFPIWNASEKNPGLSLHRTAAACAGLLQQWVCSHPGPSVHTQVWQGNSTLWGLPWKGRRAGWARLALLSKGICSEYGNGRGGRGAGCAAPAGSHEPHRGKFWAIAVSDDTVPAVRLCEPQTYTELSGDPAL